MRGVGRIAPARERIEPHLARKLGFEPTLQSRHQNGQGALLPADRHHPRR
jgi:hypothetical protein